MASSNAASNAASLTRNGGRHDRFLWSQTRDEVTLRVRAPRGAAACDVSVRVRDKWIKVALHRSVRQRGVSD
jgi:hypothetical protein